MESKNSVSLRSRILTVERSERSVGNAHTVSRRSAMAPTRLLARFEYLVRGGEQVGDGYAGDLGVE